MKTWSLVPAVFVAMLMGLPTGIVAQPDFPGRNIATEARQVFADKCAECHGADLAKPEGQFGFVLDLKRISENPAMVIPHHPDESELWILVKRDEMPPPDAAQGSLTPSQKEFIRSWISAGAPDALPVAPDSIPAVQVESSASPALATPDRTLGWVDTFHLQMIHVPIAVVLVAAIAERLLVWRRRRLFPVVCK